MSYLLEAIDWRNPRDIGFALSCRIRARISLPGQHESTALPDLSRIVTQATGKGRAGERNTGVSISGHLRFCIAAFVLLAGLPISPASPNPLAEFFNAAPRQTTAPASAERQCSPRPGTSRTAGQHWVYRLEGHRKCWFQAAEGIATVKKQVRNRAAEPRVAAPEENEAARRERKAVVDAHAELLRSARAVTSRPMRPAPELKVVNAASVFAAAGAAFVPAPSVEDLATDQLTPDHPTPRQVDTETFLAAAPAASYAVAASVPPAAPIALPIAEAADDGLDWTATRLGVLLMALGLLTPLGSSRTLRKAVLLRD
jgi:hypothetical protein